MSLKEKIWRPVMREATAVKQATETIIQATREDQIIDLDKREEEEEVTIGVNHVTNSRFRVSIVGNMATTKHSATKEDHNIVSLMLRLQRMMVTMKRTCYWLSML